MIRHVLAGAVVASFGLGVIGVSESRGAEYLYDDGVSNVTFGPPRSFAPYGDIDMLWGNYFFTDAPAEQVSHVSFGLGNLSPGGAVSIWVFDDPDDDADPTNAVPVFTMNTTGANLGFGFNEVDLPYIDVAGGFFIAIGHLAVLQQDQSGRAFYATPARFDPDGRADRSWFFYDSDIPETDLGSSGFVQRMDGPYVPIHGALAIRATTVPAPGALGVGAAGMALAPVRRRRVATGASA